jgi:hypothetical protein
MKNLFNNISQYEKNRILEMHTSKKNIVYEQDSFDDIPSIRDEYDTIYNASKDRISNSKSEKWSDDWVDEVGKEWNEPNFKNKRDYLNQRLDDKRKFDKEQRDKLSDEKHEKLVSSRPQDFDIESARQEYSNISNKLEKIKSKLLQIDDMEERLNSPLMKTWSMLNSKRNELFFTLGRDL